MPSTKELSEQLSVSLVTTHRALQELVMGGVLQRSQGKGTFVHQRYLDKKRILSETRLGLIFHSEASLADFYHSQILEGVRQSAQQLHADLILLRFGEDVRNECNGYLFVNPLPEELSQLERDAGKRPVLVVGAKSPNRGVGSIDVDNIDLGKLAVQHLSSLGHRRIGFVGGADHISNNYDRWQGFALACQERGTPASEQNVMKNNSWRLEEGEKRVLANMLARRDRPTAIFAAGYYFALDVYSAAAAAGLRIPDDLSVVGVDDPPSAEHLSPPLTTLHQPLVQLGNAAVTALIEQINRGTRAEVLNRTLWSELVLRRSTARPAG